MDEGITHNGVHGETELSSDPGIEDESDLESIGDKNVTPLKVVLTKDEQVEKLLNQVDDGDEDEELEEEEEEEEEEVDEDEEEEHDMTQENDDSKMETPDMSGIEEVDEVSELTCKECGLEFDTERGLLVHRNRKHKAYLYEDDGAGGQRFREEILKCEFCDKEFTKNRAMLEHVDGEHLHKRFKCAIGKCTTLTKWRPDILKHVKERHKIKYTVTECIAKGIVKFEALTDEEFAEEVARKAARSKGTPKPKKQKSPVEVLKFDRIEGPRAAKSKLLSANVFKPKMSEFYGGSPKRGSGGSPRKFEAPSATLLRCNLCEFTTKYNSNLRRHEKFAHSSGPGRTKKTGRPPRQFFPSAIGSPDTLPLKPRKAMNGDYPRASFKDEDSFHVMVVTVSGEKMYRFSACDTVSPRADTIRIHINAIHKQIRYRCLICNDYTTKYMTSFRGHVQNIHQLFDSCRQYAFEYSELDPPELTEERFAASRLEDPYHHLGASNDEFRQYMNDEEFDSELQQYQQSADDSNLEASYDEGRSVYTPNTIDGEDLSSSGRYEDSNRNCHFRRHFRKSSYDDSLNPFLQEMAPMFSPSSATPVQAVLGGDPYAPTENCSSGDSFLTASFYLSAIQQPNSLVPLKSVDPADLEKETEDSGDQTQVEGLNGSGETSPSPAVTNGEVTSEGPKPVEQKLCEAN